MDTSDSQVRDIVQNIGRIVTRDGGSLELEHFDQETRTVAVRFQSPPPDECDDCTVDESTVRMFLEEALRAQEVDFSSLEVTATTAPSKTKGEGE